VRNRPCFGILSPKQDTLTIKRSARRPRSFMQNHLGDRHDDGHAPLGSAAHAQEEHGPALALGAMWRAPCRATDQRVLATRDPNDKASRKIVSCGLKACDKI
jgi:hypothetical protein